MMRAFYYGKGNCELKKLNGLIHSTFEASWGSPFLLPLTIHYFLQSLTFCSVFLPFLPCVHCLFRDQREQKSQFSLHTTRSYYVNVFFFYFPLSRHELGTQKVVPNG